jgi:SAM-dependent methyltransferase
MLTLGRLPDSTWFAGKRIEKPLVGGVLYRCCRCQLKFRYPTLDGYEKLYDNTAVSSWSASAARPAWDLINNYISARLPQGGRVLDFGCYTGGLLARLGPAFGRYGVEINKAAAAVATREQLAQVWASSDDIPSTLRFDAIVASDVIEHLSDPGHFIDMLSPLLADNGIFIITTGDAENRLWNRFAANWWYCFYPEHIAFISEAWVDYYLRSSGLSVEHCERFRYRHIPFGRHFIETMLTYFYGYFPRTCLRLGNMIRAIFGHPGMTSAPGNGVSADHLIVVLARNGVHP